MTVANLLSPTFTQALAYATALHGRQTRKGGEIPYISHLLGVCSLTLEYGGTEAEAIAALLHDAIEDQGGLETRAVILERFGETVTAIVDGCTDATTTPKPPWRERKEAYIAHLPSASPSVLLVSACDKLHNARSLLQNYRVLGDAVWARFKGGKTGTLWYERALVTAFRKASALPDHLHPLIDELDRVVTELEALAAD